MKTVWILAALSGNALTIELSATEADCLAALAALPPAIARDAECESMEMLIPAGPGAPILAPLPPRRP